MKLQKEIFQDFQIFYLDNKDRLSKLKQQAETAIRFKETSNKINKLNKDIAFAKLQKAILNKKNINEKLEDSSK